MQWEEGFSVGIPEIDQQHLVIVECISLVDEAVAKRSVKARWSAVHAAVGRLADYVGRGKLDADSRLPDLAKHAEEHRRFAHELSALQRKSLHTDVSEDMISLLDQWLREHIAVSDKRYASVLLNGRVKRLPRARKAVEHS